jgi:hypothetical protein
VKAKNLLRCIRARSTFFGTESNLYEHFNLTVVEIGIETITCPLLRAAPSHLDLARPTVERFQFRIPVRHVHVSMLDVKRFELLILIQPLLSKLVGGFWRWCCCCCWWWSTTFINLCRTLHDRLDFGQRLSGGHLLAPTLVDGGTVGFLAVPDGRDDDDDEGWPFFLGAVLQLLLALFPSLMLTPTPPTPCSLLLVVAVKAAMVRAMACSVPWETLAFKSLADTGPPCCVPSPTCTSR